MFFLNFDPEEFLTFSEELFEKDELSDAEIRTIMNRCYYYCLLTVQKSKNRDKCQDYLKHDDLLTEMNNTNTLLGNIVTRLFSYRIVADYSLRRRDVHASLSVRINKNYADESIQCAQCFRENK